VIADHGNAEEMIASNGTPYTAHTTNLVPCVVIAPEVSLLHPGKLSDIAPTILDLMGIEKPKEMTGVSLITKN
jgi:2,3-bisphosphoglycerate-independent phosphoglycerate mutase